MGPVYRSVSAKDGLTLPVPGLDCCWDVFRIVNGKGEKCGIYGANSSQWMMSMQAWNAHGLYCVPLYDSLGAGSVELIICHSEVSIAFVEEKRISELLKTFPGAKEYLKTLVSFSKVSPDQKEEVEKYGLAIHAWEDFLKPVWVYGNSFESFLIAVVNPNQQSLEGCARENGITGNFESLCENPSCATFLLPLIRKNPYQGAIDDMYKTANKSSA